MPITDPARPPMHMGLGHEPDVQAGFNTPTVLYVNFEGPFMNGGCGNNSLQDCTTIFPNTQFLEHPGSPATRAAIIQATREDVEDFGVIVVGERPPAGNPYAMVVAGVPNGGGPPGVGGVAPGIDCSNTNPNITSFSFLVNDNANIQATVIHQEAAHTWGLEHVDDPSDNLFPSTGGASDPKYQDTCSTVVADVALNPTNAACNSVHTMFCNANQQNSYQEMLLLFGPPIPDQVAPLVTIDSPLDGQELDYETDFELTVTLDDDRRPAVLATTVYFDDAEAADVSLINATHTFPVNGGDAPMGHGLGNGPHTIRVDIVDEGGNPASAEVTFVIVNGPMEGSDETGADDSTGGDPTAGEGTGDDLPGGTGAGTGAATTGPELDDSGDEGCACRATDGTRGDSSTGTGPGTALLVLLTLGLWRRRD
ncbi:MYXO-CTERM sorting domain-containing protein [Paraliomyxa miuraensis]|uniref:MYXO-CTERM sorting domain-containing protein n=1 Tax=Paraliomyxa miuraensis TaxID=376150 RepID=UPI00224E9792|nr:MYXO-CTERM sorting domain-containing protein [Paraliomyxa miuraensis]MCX4241540.1 MYXO-CTERM sorting domain-containing protein [Paraliomyxa miuraensis]